MTRNVAAALEALAAARTPIAQATARRWLAVALSDEIRMHGVQVTADELIAAAREMREHAGLN